MDRRKRERVIVTKKDVATVSAEELVGEKPPESTPEPPVEQPANHPSSYKIDNAILDELKKRAEAEFDSQLSNQLKNLKGQTCSGDDTIRIRIALEVCLEPRELKE